jgi:hypothetical protein
VTDNRYRNTWPKMYKKYYFFLNVFRATRSKTTSLPAALNQTRRINTLDEFYYMNM